MTEFRPGEVHLSIADYRALKIPREVRWCRPPIEVPPKIRRVVLQCFYCHLSDVPKLDAYRAPHPSPFVDMPTEVACDRVAFCESPPRRGASSSTVQLIRYFFIGQCKDCLTIFFWEV